MNSEELYRSVRKAVAEVLFVEEADIQPESRFLEDLGATSADLLMLVMVLEEELETEIPTEDVRELKTLADTMRYLEERLATKAEAV